MHYWFGACSVDTETSELSVGSRPVAVEPQVFALLRLLIENRDRLLTKDDIVEGVWGGRIISDAAISSRIKSARQAVGDDGQGQRIIRTIPKRGYRFVADVTVVTGSPPRPRQPEAVIAPPAPSSRPSIAVLPFALTGAATEDEWLADALPQEIIGELSRLRWLFVIARGSSFRFRGADVDIAEVGRALRVGYCLSGRIAVDGPRYRITVELSATRDCGVVWDASFTGRQEDIREVHGQIAGAIANALDLRIPMNEALSSKADPPESLDAWGAFHLGLRRLYRFSRDANAEAAAYFERAIELSPNFARAHAGLSFAHFEDGFLRFASDGAAAAKLARTSAERALDCDPMDPFCNMVMGRAFWLTPDLEASVPWLERAVQLSPNYAQARYAWAWSEALLGQRGESAREAEAALRLSPLDPLAYGMLGVRALSELVIGDGRAAATWAAAAARAPGAHAYIDLIAAIAHHLDGDDERARPWAASAQRRQPGLSTAHFLHAFPFRDATVKHGVEGALQRLGVA
jgi:TolB-like protein